MIGKLSYDEMLTIANRLNKASNNIKLNVDDEDIKKFLGELDTYIRFLLSTIQLYKDSDEALKLIMQKNK